MSDIKYPLNKSKTLANASPLSYAPAAKAWKQLPVLCTPTRVLDGAAATGGSLVGKGNLCRVFGAATDFVAFGPSSIITPTVTTANAALMGATVQIFVATDDYIRCSASVTRVEIIED